jgi:hypothetical protein
MENIMKSIIRVLPLALLALSPLGLAAQACLGLPAGSGTSVLASLSFPSNATGFTLSGVGALSEGLYGSASIGVVAPDVQGASNLTVAGGGVSYEVPRLLETASICPSAGVSYGFVDAVNLLSIPLGVAVGTTVPLDEKAASTLTPYFTPQFVWTRATVDNMDGSTSSSYLSLNAGATFGFGQFVAGPFVTKPFEDGLEAVFGIQGGLIF